jgi:hypothetical protein
VKHDYYSVYLASQYYVLNKPNEGDKIMDELAENCLKNIRWYKSLTNEHMINASQRDLDLNMRILASILSQCKEYNREAIFNKYLPALNQYGN